MDNLQKYNICINTHTIDISICELGVKKNLQSGNDALAFPQTGGRIQNDDRELNEDIREYLGETVYTSLQ
jgi:hypothetical protein